MPGWCNLPLPWPEGDLLLYQKARTVYCPRIFYSTVGDMHCYSRMLGRPVFLPSHPCTSYHITHQAIAVQIVLPTHHHDSTIAVFATIASTRCSHQRAFPRFRVKNLAARCRAHQCCSMQCCAAARLARQRLANLG